ncbi:major facilitator superfamily domain-containing protein [Zychaea mexicana]|uniref:major facilitator superfamily domain-containing protein n=1 Tax=Zychaea mexicana TaxID=64656 RepID=UPI0022FE7444|nr:major facilitator superfamily domain-containing protein [Zychaea mexicana]KAI9496085.1 major facilitator superfamily domain-containing protein [Zychaea mexicana]
MAPTRLEEEKAEVVHADTLKTPDSDSTNNAEQGFQDEHAQSAAEKKLVRKISYTFLPLVTWIVMVQFADKSSLAISAVLGIYQDTGITGSQFSWLGSLFFLGYLIMQIPNQVLIQKFSIRRYLGVCIVVFGAVMLFTALAQTFAQLAALRFLLGFFEATCLPCLYIIVPHLYRREEQTFYFGIVTMCQGVGSVLGNLVAVGISQMGGERLGLEMWRWNHIIFGAITVLLGILCFFFLLDNPRSWMLRLTEEERHIVDKRTEDNAVIRSRKINYKHFLEALKEPRLYCIGLAAICINMQNGGLLVFSAQLIRTLGDFTPTESILLKIPGGVASTIFILGAAIVARRIRQIAYTGMVMCVISLSGVVVLAAVPHGSVKLLGYYLSWAMGGAGALYAAMVGTNVSGYSKKIFYNSVLVICSTLGSFIGPLVMLDHEAPRYTTGMVVYCVGNTVAFFCFLAARILMARENKRRIANPPEKKLDVTEGWTDQEDRSFIYKL